MLAFVAYVVVTLFAVTDESVVAAAAAVADDIDTVFVVDVAAGFVISAALFAVLAPVLRSAFVR